MSKSLEFTNGFETVGGINEAAFFTGGIQAEAGPGAAPSSFESFAYSGMVSSGDGESLAASGGLTEQDVRELAVLSLSGQVRPFGVELAAVVSNPVDTRVRTAANKPPDPKKFQESKHVKKPALINRTCLVWNPHTQKNYRASD